MKESPISILRNYRDELTSLRRKRQAGVPLNEAVREGLCSRRAQERACQAPLQGLWCVPCQGVWSGSPHERRVLRPGKVRRVDGNLTGPQEGEGAWTTMPISQS